MLNVPGRVLLGPRKLLGGYARIIALKDGSGRIEIFDAACRTWMLAPESVTFGDIWSAPSVPALQWAMVGDKP